MFEIRRKAIRRLLEDIAINSNMGAIPDSWPQVSFKFKSLCETTSEKHRIRVNSGLKIQIRPFRIQSKPCLGPGVQNLPCKHSLRQGFC
jgi:hypothetical protein